MGAHSDIRRMVSDFVAEANSLGQRMLFSDRMRLNAMDLHILRAQLQVLDAQAANLEYLLSAASSAGNRPTMGTKPASHSTVKNQERALQSEEGRADFLKRAS